MEHEADDGNDIMLIGLSIGDSGETKEALTSAVYEYGQAVYSFIRWKLQDHYGVPGDISAMARDNFSETCLQLVRCAKAGKLNEVRSLRSYFIAIAGNVLKNFIRHEKRRKTISLDDEDDSFGLQVGYAELGLDKLEYEEIRDALYDCIDGLPERQRRYIRLRVADPDNPVEPRNIAKIYGVSSLSVSSQLFNARKRIEECMQRKHHPIPHLEN